MHSSRFRTPEAGQCSWWTGAASSIGGYGLGYSDSVSTVNGEPFVLVREALPSADSRTSRSRARRAASCR